MKKIFEVVKANKKNLVRGALLVGGTIVAAVIAKTTLRADEVEVYEVFDADLEQDAVNELKKKLQKSNE